MVYADAAECYVQWMNMCECLSSIVGKLKKRKGLTCQNDDINNNNHDGKVR